MVLTKDDEIFCSPYLHLIVELWIYSQFNPKIDQDFVGLTKFLFYFFIPKSKSVWTFYKRAWYLGDTVPARYSGCTSVQCRLNRYGGGGLWTVVIQYTASQSGAPAWGAGVGGGQLLVCWVTGAQLAGSLFLPVPSHPGHPCSFLSFPGNHTGRGPGTKVRPW